jgi:hypothetical protein
MILSLGTVTPLQQIVTPSIVPQLNPQSLRQAYPLEVTKITRAHLIPLLMDCFHGLLGLPRLQNSVVWLHKLSATHDIEFVFTVGEHPVVPAGRHLRGIYILSTEH